MDNFYYFLGESLLGWFRINNDALEGCKHCEELISETKKEYDHIKKNRPLGFDSSNLRNLDDATYYMVLYHEHRANHVDYKGEQIGDLDPSCELCQDHIKLRERNAT